MRKRNLRGFDIPEAHRLMADVDATLVQQALDLPQGQWKADIHLWTPRGRQVEIRA